MADKSKLNSKSNGPGQVPAVPGPTNPMVSPLLTDLYQFTMSYAYWKAGKHQERAVWVPARLGILRNLVVFLFVDRLCFLFDSLLNNGWMNVQLIVHLDWSKRDSLSLCKFGAFTSLILNGRKVVSLFIVFHWHISNSKWKYRILFPYALLFPFSLLDAIAQVQKCYFFM